MNYNAQSPITQLEILPKEALPGTQTEKMNLFIHDKKEDKYFNFFIKKITYSIDFYWKIIFHLKQILNTFEIFAYSY